MKPEEAIDILEEIKVLDDTLYSYSPVYMQALETAIFALKEVRQYQLIKDVTVGEIAEVINTFSKIGTVEQCREAVEKQKPKKPHRNYKKFSGLWCKCGWYLGQKQCLDIKYCPNCGQAIDENLEG